MSEINKSLKRPFNHKKSIKKLYEETPQTQRRSFRFRQQRAPNQVYFGPIKPINPKVINVPHYGYVGEQYVFGSIPNFKKRQYQKPQEYLLK